MKILDPWTSEIPGDYEQIMKDFGISKLTDSLKKRMPDHYLIRRDILFAHRDLDKIISAYEKKKPFAAMTGIKPSNMLHLGNKIVAEQMIMFQKMGGKIFYAVADIEAFHDNKQSLEKSHKLAIDNVADILALGIDPDPKKAYFYKQSEEDEVMRNAYLFSRNVTMNTLKAIYGEKTLGLYQSALIQVADILVPQTKKFNGPKPVVVPIGIDQDPHMRLTRDVAAKNNLVLPSSLNNKFMRSLTGSVKMSKREPMGMITLSDSPELAKKKVMRALTGGRNTVEEQKKLGGEPLKCVVYELYVFILMPDDKELKKTYEDSKSGKIVCGECKKDCTNRLGKILKEHQEKKKKMLPKAEKLLKH